MRWMFLMLIFIPISILMNIFHASQVVMFIISCLAIIPLAGFMGVSTEEFAKYRGATIGGLLNATFGNATELIICLVALHQGEIEVVKASLIGSIIGNILLVLGLSVFLGGLKYKMQSFNPEGAGTHAAMLAIAVISLLVPALFVRVSPGMLELASEPRIFSLSMGVAGVLLLLYVSNLLFSLHTHQALFSIGEVEVSEAPTWSQRKAALVLLVCTLLVSLESHFLVDSIESVKAKWHLSTLFIGIIVIPIIGNAAEHSTAVIMAMKNKMDLSFNIAVSSSIQIAMFVAPVLIIISPLLGHPMSILFHNSELVAVSAAVAIAALIAMDGKSHWLEGAQLLAAYAILALAFYYIPS